MIEPRECDSTPLPCRGIGRVQRDQPFELGFAGKAPLWTYVLAEATASAFKVHDGRIDGAQIAPMRLGPVGGRIVTETFVGLLAADPRSVLYDSSFRPDPAFARNGQFGFRELIRAVISS